MKIWVDISGERQLTGRRRRVGSTICPRLLMAADCSETIGENKVDQICPLTTRGCCTFRERKIEHLQICEEVKMIELWLDDPDFYIQKHNASF